MADVTVTLLYRLNSGPPASRNKTIDVAVPEDEAVRRRAVRLVGGSWVQQDSRYRSIANIIATAKGTTREELDAGECPSLTWSIPASPTLKEFPAVLTTAEALAEWRAVETDLRDLMAQIRSSQAFIDAVAEWEAGRGRHA